jgi:hypothetical protein
LIACVTRFGGKCGGTLSNLRADVPLEDLNVERSMDLAHEICHLCTDFPMQHRVAIRRDEQSDSVQAYTPCGQFDAVRAWPALVPQAS